MHNHDSKQHTSERLLFNSTHTNIFLLMANCQPYKNKIMRSNLKMDAVIDPDFRLYAVASYEKGIEPTAKLKCLCNRK